MMLNRKTRLVKFFSLACLLCLPLNSALAQDDFEAYRRQQIEGAQQVKTEFHEYKEQQDREFGTDRPKPGRSR